MHQRGNRAGDSSVSSQAVVGWSDGWFLAIESVFYGMDVVGMVGRLEG
jgi:hypothetical protein